MNDTFKVIKASRLSNEVAEQIKGLIFDGTLKPGDKLPSERELSQTVGIGRLSLREGLRILESMGILETKYGVHSGTYVAESVVDKLTDKISDIMRFGNISLDQLIEARIEISLISLKYFHERRTAEDIKKLEKCVREAEEQVKAGIHPLEKYIQFHRLIAEGSRNRMFLLIYNSLVEILVKEFVSKYPSPLAHSRKILELKKGMLKHLKEKDLKNALSTMQEYLIFLKKSIEWRISRSAKRDGLAETRRKL